MYVALKDLILPPGCLLLLLLVALILRWRDSRLAGPLAWVAALLLYLSATPLVAESLLQSLEIYPPLPADHLPASKAQAIVVLSAEAAIGPEYGDVTIGQMTLERLRYGARLHDRTGLPMLVTGGAVECDAPTLGEAMREALKNDFGITDVWVEGRASDTMENAENSARILKEKGIDSIYLVTHAWHMPRAVKAFEHAGLTVTPAPTAFTGDPTFEWRSFMPTPKAMTGTYYALYEILGGLAYDLTYDGWHGLDVLRTFSPANS